MQQNRLTTVDDFVNFLADKWKNIKEGVAEGVPQPGPSSGAPKQFGSNAEIQTRQMTAKQLIDSVPGLPYYNNVVDDWDAKDYSWGVTKKVIEYATYLKKHPESLAKLPPILVLNGKFEDGAHRVSAIWLLQQRMDPKNSLWSNAKLNVQFVKQGVSEGVMSDLDEDRKPVYQLPELTLILDPHFIERMGTRQLNGRVVAQLMSRLKNLTQELSQFEPGQKIWINSPSLKAKLGMRRLMDRNGKITYLLKTVVKDPTWDNPDPTVTTENFADGRKPGRKGLAKRSGVDCKQPVSKLRSIAKNSSGERQRMAHWCANMKSGRSK
jgi:hypothetical protein